MILHRVVRQYHELELSWRMCKAVSTSKRSTNRMNFIKRQYQKNFVMLSDLKERRRIQSSTTWHPTFFVTSLLYYAVFIFQSTHNAQLEFFFILKDNCIRAYIWIYILFKIFQMLVNEGIFSLIKFLLKVILGNVMKFTLI